MAKVESYVRDYINEKIDNVQLEGLCPICKTGRNQYGECWLGHIVIDVRRPTKRAAKGGRFLVPKDYEFKIGGGCWYEYEKP